VKRGERGEEGERGRREERGGGRREEVKDRVKI
jgi:hypothetical protein